MWEEEQELQDVAVRRGTNVSCAIAAVNADNVWEKRPSTSPGFCPACERDKEEEEVRRAASLHLCREGEEGEDKLSHLWDCFTEVTAYAAKNTDASSLSVATKTWLWPFLSHE